MKRNSSLKRNQSNNQKQFPLKEFIKNSVRERVLLSLMNFAAEFIENEVVEYCGSRGNRDGNYCRYGFDPHAWAYFLGQALPIRKQRVRGKDKSGEVELRNYKALHDPELMGDEVMKHMLRGCSTRDYDGAITHLAGKSKTSKSKVSEVFIKASQKDLDLLNSRSLNDKDFFAIFIDGIQFDGEHLIASVGIDISGKKMILGIRSGDTENSEVVKDLLNDLSDRGLKIDENTLFILDGSKALKKGAKRVFGDKAIIVRCLKHKIDNIEKYIPDEKWGELRRKMFMMSGLENYEEAKKEYNKIRTWLKGISERAANSLDEGGEDLLVLQLLNCPSELRKSLYTTNIIESLFSVVRAKINRVKRWRKGTQMTERWFASVGLLHEKNRMRKVVGMKQIPEFLKTLRSFPLDKIREVA
jgi:putative transposase